MRTLFISCLYSLVTFTFLYCFENGVLHGPIIQTEQIIGPKICLNLCKKMVSCKAINYQQTSLECQLLFTTKQLTPTMFASLDGYIYGEVQERKSGDCVIGENCEVLSSDITKCLKTICTRSPLLLRGSHPQCPSSIGSVCYPICGSDYTSLPSTCAPNGWWIPGDCRLLVNNSEIFGGDGGNRLTDKNIWNNQKITGVRISTICKFPNYLQMRYGENWGHAFSFVTNIDFTETLFDKDEKIKQVNVEVGHQSGDQLIKHLSLKTEKRSISSWASSPCQYPESSNWTTSKGERLLYIAGGYGNGIDHIRFYWL